MPIKSPSSLVNDFKSIGGYNSFKRHISEALFIKDKKPNLNVQKDAYRLNLYIDVNLQTQLVVKQCNDFVDHSAYPDDVRVIRKY